MYEYAYGPKLQVNINRYMTSWGGGGGGERGGFVVLIFHACAYDPRVIASPE